MSDETSKKYPDYPNGRPKTFEPHDKLRPVKGGQQYLEVKWRLIWFREKNGIGIIKTELISDDPLFYSKREVLNSKTNKVDVVEGWGRAVFKATITDDDGAVATGYKSEVAADFPDYLEKSETGAIGRALAGLGYGTQFTMHEYENGTDRLVDSPVEVSTPAATASKLQAMAQARVTSPPTAAPPPAPVSSTPAPAQGPTVQPQPIANPTMTDEGVNTALEAWKKIDAVGFTKLYTFVREAVKREPTPADRRQLFINLQARSFLFALQHEVDREGVMMRKLTKSDSLFSLVRGSSLQDIEKLYLDHLLGIVVEENLSPDFRSRYHAKLQELLHPNEEVAA